MVNKQTLSKKIGKRVAKIRIKRNMTQESLAFEAGLNRAYVGYIERGERNPSVFTMSRLATALRVKLYDLFKI